MIDTFLPLGVSASAVGLDSTVAAIYGLLIDRTASGQIKVYHNFTLLYRAWKLATALK